MFPVVDGQFCEVNVKPDLELVMCDNARRADLMAVRQAEMERNLRACDGRDKAFNEGPAGSEVEQATIARVPAGLAPSAQNTPILRPIV